MHIQFCCRCQFVFLLALLSLWNLGLWSYVTSLDPFEPRYQNEGRNPGMSFRLVNYDLYLTIFTFILFSGLAQKTFIQL